MVHRVLEINRRLSARFRVRKDVELYIRYDREVADLVAALPDSAVVVDLGGGRTCSFAAGIDRARGVRIVGVDVSAEELAANAEVDETHVADVAAGLPFEPGSIDLIVSRTLLEHVDGVDRAAGQMAEALKDGAHTLHLIPCRYSLFALVARFVPIGFAKRVIHRLNPESQGVVEFDVVYDRGHPAALERTFRAAGFRDVEVDCTWDQSDYWKAVFPLFLLVYGYQRLVELLDIRVLASYAIVRAVK